MKADTVNAGSVKALEGYVRLARARCVPGRRSGARRGCSAASRSRRTPTSSFPGSTATVCGRLCRRTAGSRSSSSAAARSACGCTRRTREIRALAPAGIEFAPPRRERSTGHGRHEFEIVVDPAATVEDDLRPARLHDQRDGAAALRRRDRRSLPRAHRPRAGRAADRLAGELRRGSAPARPRASGSSRSSGSTPTRRRSPRCARRRALVAHVSGERIGGGLAADGMGELSKLLLGREPRKAL